MFYVFFYNLKVLVLNVSTLVFWCLIVLGLIFVGRTGQNIFALPFLLEKTKRKKKTSSFFFTYTLNVSKHNCMVCGVYEAFFRGLRGGWQNNFLGVTIIRPSWVLIWLSTPRKKTYWEGVMRSGASGSNPISPAALLCITRAENGVYTRYIVG